MKFITTTELLVNGDYAVSRRHRLNQSIATLASIGRLSNGGVKRIAHTTEDIETRNLVRQSIVIPVAIEPSTNNQAVTLI